LTKALPRLLREVRDLVGARRVTIVFDRGGWSPKLFATMIKDGFDVPTYRKGRCRRINERRFIARHAELDGCRVDYVLHDQPVRFLNKQIATARADLARLERQYGAAAADNAEPRRPTMRGFKIAHGRLGKQLRTARARVAQLFEQRRDVAKRVEVRDLNERAMVKLATERKHLTDIIKMVAYQAESDLVTLLRPHYARVDQEGRTLLHELFAASGDIRVGDGELHITLAPLSSPHRTYAAQALSEMLDQTATIFPGSRLRIRFSVRPPPRIGLAFPGSPVERSAATTVAPPP
jgi:hypothetical protein